MCSWPSSAAVCVCVSYNWLSEHNDRSDYEVRMTHIRDSSQIQMINYLKNKVKLASSLSKCSHLKLNVFPSVHCDCDYSAGHHCLCVTVTMYVKEEA